MRRMMRGGCQEVRDLTLDFADTVRLTRHLLRPQPIVLDRRRRGAQSPLSKLPIGIGDIPHIGPVVHRAGDGVEGRHFNPPLLLQLGGNICHLSRSLRIVRYAHVGRKAFRKYSRGSHLSPMRLDGMSQPKSQDIHAIVGLLLILGIRLLDHRQLSLQLGKAPRGVSISMHDALLSCPWFDEFES
ncbi:hypothetical protein [Streptomyces sp. NPDC052127]|uniref:hypothetical protein n=1 Tax=Streptomyces sp. NPDC052127 TaxID=3155679 RepID=UPI00341C02F6